MADTSTDRPFFNKSIVDLERTFRDGSADEKVLLALKHELTFRSTPRAQRLRDRVSKTLEEPALLSKAAQTTQPRMPEHIPPRKRAAPSQEATTSAQREPVQPPPSAPSNEPRIERPHYEANDPSAILGAWTALEALAPQTYRRPEDLAGGDRTCVASITGNPLPWEKGERSRPKYQLYYQVILGSIPMDRATEELVRAFGTDEERNSRVREKAAIAAVLIDRSGRVAEENGVAISSFAWALPQALRLELRALGAWSDIAPKLEEQLREIVCQVDNDGNALPLTRESIDNAYRWLVASFGLPDHLVEAPSFAVRTYHYFKSKNPPEPLLLNSFFLEDLDRAAAYVTNGEVPTGLGQYLGMKQPEHTADLLTNLAAVERAVAPSLFPVARWPSPGGHPLVVLQQAAVNTARAELRNADGISAINGPPGTGKTTLLRDVVAASVVDRAAALAAFDSPETAFTPSGQKMSAGERAFFHLYTLDPSIKGHEVVVASSNNKAVENVSRELPGVEAVGWPLDELSYFRTVSDALQHTGQGEGEVPVSSPTWGMVAAVLGNAANRAAFQRSFWFDEEYAFRHYLKAAKGDSVVREVKDPDSGKVIERHTPAIVAAERPPSPKTAQSTWRRIRGQFLDLQADVEQSLAAVESVRQLCLTRTTKSAALTQSIRDRETVASELAGVEEHSDACIDDVAACRAALDAANFSVRRHRRKRPGLLAWLFRRPRWHEWTSRHADYQADVSGASGALKEAEQAASEARTHVQTLSNAHARLDEDIAELTEEVAQLTQSITDSRDTLGLTVVDEAFFAQGHDAWNLAAPWLPKALHRKREALFAMALNLHRAFIDAAAQKVLHNIAALMDVFMSGAPQAPEKRQLLGDLWSTLFLIIPVVSTTFASVDRMLGALPPRSIGWLLIDEAGQALPQAAVGAIMRARRSIIVGDPLQIPPVVSMPDRLTAEVCNYFNVTTDAWASPVASTQTLADRASSFQATFASDRGPRRVGLPLLVHRRCDEPMFGISNRIAYSGQMVHATPKRREGSALDILGRSKWFDIDGQAQSKWCPDEGEVVVGLLGECAAADVADLDLFIISPFRIVAFELRRRIQQQSTLSSFLGGDARTWTRDRVGTIHTVQGREADAVFLVLGAPTAAQYGARQWAAGTPNILNVAVSRAKQRIYVIGSHGAWSGVGHMGDVANSLERVVI